ncbi:tight adherence protein C [Naumannella cuiyingiana]|uniref:Tight adherence protein C n=1 Tax=Naumannella cuiyingiana TaxID=1347891 RepID=A0A7Z0D8J1_9ACTN|nr:tight adherence protein C [Naumannella cuiyingiana]
MGGFSAFWPALAATGALVLFLLGYRMLRSDVGSYLDAEDLILLKDERRREEARRNSPLSRLAGRLVPSIRRLIGPAGSLYLQRTINRAGRPDGVSVDTVLRRIAFWLILLAPVGLLFIVQGQPFALPLLLICALWLPLAGILRRARTRRARIDRDLPDFLDILAVTVSAGIAFRAALARVSDRFDGPLAEEVRITLDQLTHGASLRSAFLGLQERTGSVPMRSFVTAFLQAEELGAPLAETLNQIAVDMRRDSAQAMRRLAGETAPRITLVTTLFLVPAALIFTVVGLVIGADLNLSELLGALR